MASAEDLQKQEITALQSIFAEDFLECPPPKAWKGAARLPEFIIRVLHPDIRYASRISFQLHVKLPKTYPLRAHPVFNIEQPIVGLTPADVTTLSATIQAEAQKHHGSEMVFQIVMTCQEWIERNAKLPIDVPGASLASEMRKRASEEEKAKQQVAAAEAEQEYARASQLAAQFKQQIEEDALKKEELQRLEKERHQKARERARSDATEKPWNGVTTESFDHEIEYRGLRFDTVKLYHPRKVSEFLGTTYSAEPVSEDTSVVLRLDLHVISFDSPYYATHAGKKKLRQVESELQRLTRIDHVNVLRTFAVSLTGTEGTRPLRLSVLMEEQPPLTLKAVLQNCDTLREERASDYLGQILSALHSVHSADLYHRGICAACVGLARREDSGQTNLVKLNKVAFHTKLRDLHKSQPFAVKYQADQDEDTLPDGWLPWDDIDSPLEYTRSRDIHAVGVLLLQMLMGLDVIRQFPEPRAALRASSISPQMQPFVMDMLTTSKKNPVSCLTLLGKLAATTFHAAPRSRAISFDNSKTHVPRKQERSPEVGHYFLASARTRQASRWREDWEELELLGRGGFGSVMKARNKLDNRIYAVKKIKLRATQGDNKIFREVNALSRLSHRFIVRYYTTWLETAEIPSGAASSASDSESTDDGRTSVPQSARSQEGSTDPFSIDLDDLGSGSRTSFPSIHFSASGAGSGDDEDEDDSGGITDLFEVQRGSSGYLTPPVPTLRTLYIQMEFVENQTLRERIAEGLTEEESWRLFQQLVDALVHMSSLGILHRDIKLTNIFIDGNGDCKVGDFGLATSSLAAVDPSDVSPHSVVTQSDMTLEVGTRLYIAPEILAPRGGPRNHAKADIYSLGIVFFEMNYTFSTSSERIAVIEKLRHADIDFPTTWESKRTRQRSIITWLLQHNPADRPTALELSQSPMLPPRLEEEYFKGALAMMAKPDSPHYQAVLSSLFNQPPRPVRGLLYDNEMPEHASLHGIVTNRLVEMFRLHGAVDMEAPLLMPNMKLVAEDARQALLLDRHGEVVMLPANAMVPFARLAARVHLTRIKRFHIADMYRDNAIGGHPRVSKAAVFDIVTPDLANGPDAAMAELIGIMNECLDAFPNLGHTHEIHVSHSQISEVALGRIPKDLRPGVIEIISQTKSSASQKKALFVKKGLQRSTIDELEALSETYSDLDYLMWRLEKVSPQLSTLTSRAFEDIRRTLELASLIGVTRQIIFKPLMTGKHHEYFRNGVCFEVVKRTKKTEILAAGGRYDHLIARFSPPTAAADAVCAVGLQIAVERISASLAAFQRMSVGALVKEQRSFGFWSARRCDVYVVAFQPGHLAERLEVAALLWRNGISADVMYETGVADADLESLAELCAQEGILFTVYPRPRGAHREVSSFKVKSVLKGTESEISQQDLVGWLQQQIAEQKRVDAGTSGVAAAADSAPGGAAPKESASALDVQLLLPGDTKKQQRKTIKQIFLDRAYSRGMQVRAALHGALPLLALELPQGVFDALARGGGQAWLADDDAWRALAAGLPTAHAGYAQQVRDALVRRRADGAEFVLLYSVREERVALLTLV